MDTDLDRAYLAGLLDGEGHVGLTLTSAGNRLERWQTHYLIVTIGMTYQPVLLWAKAATGSGVMVTLKPKAQRLQMYTLRWSNLAAASLLQELLPFMRVKRAQAELALRFAEEMGSRPHQAAAISEVEWNRRESLRLAISTLNRPGGQTPLPKPFGAKVKEPRFCLYCSKTMEYATRKRLYCDKRCQWNANKVKYNEQHKQHQQELRAKAQA